MTSSSTRTNFDYTNSIYFDPSTKSNPFLSKSKINSKTNPFLSKTNSKSKTSEVEIFSIEDFLNKKDYIRKKIEKNINIATRRATNKYLLSLKPSDKKVVVKYIIEYSTNKYGKNKDIELAIKKGEVNTEADNLKEIDEMLDLYSKLAKQIIADRAVIKFIK